MDRIATGMDYPEFRRVRDRTKENILNKMEESLNVSRMKASNLSQRLRMRNINRDTDKTEFAKTLFTKLARK